MNLNDISINIITLISFKYYCKYYNQHYLSVNSNKLLKFIINIVFLFKLNIYLKTRNLYCTYE